MSDITLYRLAGVCAIAGGLLRAANVFVTGIDPAMLQWDYLVTDVFLLFGLIGIYVKYRHVAGFAGLAGFAAGAIGLLLVRSSRTLDNYKIAATVTLIGVALLGLTFAVSKGAQRIPGLLLVAALVVGVAGAMMPAFTQANMIAALLFGAGFVAAGAEILRAS
jgi:hypothetical protein